MPATTAASATGRRTAATAPSPAYARASARGKGPRLSSTVIATERAGPHAALTARRSVSSGSAIVSVEGPGSPTVVNSAAPTDVSSVRRPIAGVASTAARPAPVIIPSVVKGVAPGVVAIVVINRIAVVPVKSPTAPAPAIAAKKADSEAQAERKIRAAIPNSRIGIPARPRSDRTTVHHPGVVRRDIHDVGIGGLNDDRGALRGDGLLGCRLETAGLLRALAHYLHRVHYLFLLVVIGVTQRGRPGQIFVHISKDRGKCGERLNTRVPRLLIDRLAQGVTL